MEDLLDIVIKNQRASLKKGKDSEVGGVIKRDSNDSLVFVQNMAGGTSERMAVDAICKGGPFEAIWHSHPPVNFLHMPKEYILFTPPSEPDVYTSVVAALNGVAPVSFVMSMKGIYTIIPGHVAQHNAYEFAKEFTAGYGPTAFIEFLSECSFPSEAIISENGGYGGLKKKTGNQWFDELMSTEHTNHITKTAVSFKDALQQYIAHYARYGVRIEFYERRLYSTPESDPIEPDLLLYSTGKKPID